MVASGVPEPIDHHAAELAKMALDLLAKVIDGGETGFFSQLLNKKTRLGGDL